MSYAEQVSGQDRVTQPGSAAMRGWLLLLGLLVYAMILIGGATRLTDSGLSITEWAPIHGALPPLSDAAWQAEFEKYRQTAEYQMQNRGMSMGEFQYIHRGTASRTLPPRSIQNQAISPMMRSAREKCVASL
ncbi:MAG: COX15/CtaA family protein [Pseudomonadota bacterium]